MSRAAVLAVIACAALGLGGIAHAGTAASPTQIVPLGTEFRGECVLDGGRIDGRLASWEISGVIPAFLHGGNGGVKLAAPVDVLPRFGNQKGDQPFGNEWVQVPWLTASPLDQDCTVRSFDPLQAVTLEVPGPHVFVQYDQRVSFVAVPSDAAPTPQPCARNDPDFPDPSSEIPPPPDTGDERVWVVKSFCNTTKLVGLHVTSRAACPQKTDMSGWPAMPYISQYDAGARLGLPIGSNRRGGNACGPSSLLMAMLESAGPSDLPTLPEVFDATMRLAAADVTANTDNVFVGYPKAVAYLHTLGWKSARTVDLGRDVEEMTRKILLALAKGPIVISTAFGTRTWGLSGGGHMIVIVGADRRGNFIVEDPAGNWFSTPKGGYSDTSRGHYGPGSCGHRALYPHYWLLAHTTGRWFLELGQRSSVRPAFDSHPGRRLPARVLAAAPGTVVSIEDAHPGSKDAPRSFFLQDPAGRRVGWIDGRAVEGMPGATAGQDIPGWTDPAIGDPSIRPESGAPPATPRALVASGPGPGTTLRVTAPAGARFALTMEIWGNGKVVARHTLTGTGTGDPQVVSLPAPPPGASTSPAPVKPGKSSKVVAALAAGTPRVSADAISVRLTCPARAGSPCRYTTVLNATLAGRTVRVGGASGAVGQGKTVSAVIRTSTAALARVPNLRVSLVVTHLQAGRPGTVVLRREVRIR